MPAGVVLHATAVLSLLLLLLLLVVIIKLGLQFASERVLIALNLGPKLGHFG